MGDQMGTELKIREDLTSKELRAHARREWNGRASARMYAIANALEGMKRADAARLAGMERQALRDAVVRYNAECQGRRIIGSLKEEAPLRGQAEARRGPGHHLPW